MIVIKVELHSAITGRTTTIGLMHVVNDGTGTHSRGNYDVRIIRKDSTNKVTRETRVENHPRLSKPIWSLISKALIALGY